MNVLGMRCLGHLEIHRTSSSSLTCMQCRFSMTNITIVFMSAFYDFMLWATNCWIKCLMSVTGFIYPPWFTFQWQGSCTLHGLPFSDRVHIPSMVYLSVTGFTGLVLMTHLLVQRSQFQTFSRPYYVTIYSLSSPTCGERTLHCGTIKHIIQCDSSVVKYPSVFK